MASRGGGRSPGATAVGRGRARERAKSALSLLPVRPGASRTLPPQSPEAGTTVAPPAPGDVAGAGDDTLSTKAHIASLASGVDINDVREHFKTMCGAICEGDVRVSHPVLLGGGKAELVLKGVSTSELEELKSEAHMIKGSQVEVQFQPFLEGEGNGDTKEQEEGPIKIEVQNFPSATTAEVVKTFFGVKKSGGCRDAVADISEVRPGVFHVTFCDHKIAARVMSETRTYRKVSLQMSWVEERSGTSESDSDDESNQIEVHDVPSSVTEKTLKAYFEVNKSGGCKGAVSDCKQIKEGVFVVTFFSHEVAAKVMLQKNHKLHKATLSLKYVHQPKKGEMYKMNQLVIHGLPDGVEEGVVKLIVGDVLDMDDEDDFDLVINDDSSGVITFANDYPAKELQMMKETISSQEIEGATVTVEMVKVVKPGIHIYNTSTVCDGDILNLYFSRPEKSGGGEVESVTVLSEKEAIVTFADPTVVKRVLQKNHTARFGSEVVVEEHRIQSLSTTTSTEMVSAEPVEFPLDPLLLQSINPNALQQTLNSQAIVSTDMEKGMLVVYPKGKPRPDWHQECEKLVPEHLAKTTRKETVSISNEVSEQAMSSLRKLQTYNPHLCFELSEDKTEIAVAGETNSVLQAKEALNSLCSELVIDTASIILTPEEYSFLDQIKKHEFPTNVECIVDASKFTVVLKGPKGVVAELKATMRSIVNHSSIPVSLDQMVIDFFKTQTGRVKLKNFLEERNCRAALHFTHFHPTCLHLLSDPKEANDIKAVVGQLRHHVTSRDIPIPHTVVPILAEFEEFVHFCQATEQKYEILIKHAGHEVLAAGFVDKVTSSLAELQSFLGKLASPLPPVEMKVSTLVGDSLNKSLQRLQVCLKGVQLKCDTRTGHLKICPLHYLKPGWEETCKSIVLEYIEKNIAELKLPVPNKAYQEVMQEIYESERKDDTFVYHYPPNATSLSLAGDPNTIHLMKEKITQICANHLLVREDVSLKPDVFEFLSQLKMEDLINRFQNVEIEPVPDTHSLILSGQAKGVKEVRECIPSITENIISVPVDIDGTIIQYLGTENGREKLFTLLRGKRSDKCCAVYISDSPVKLYLVCKKRHKSNVERASKAIAENTSVQPLNIPDLLLPFLSKLSEFRALVNSLERELPAMIKVEGRNIVVAGFRDGVTRSTENISAFVKKQIAHFKPLSIPINPMIGMCIQRSLEGLQECMSSIHVTCKPKSDSEMAVYPSEDTKPDWKEECQGLFSSYVDKEYLRETIQIPKEVAKDVFYVLAAAKTKQNFTFEMNDDKECAVVAGERRAVKTVQQKIYAICNQTQTTKMIKLSSREYDFFTQIGQQGLKSKVDIKFSPDKHCLAVTGSIHDVSHLCKSIEELVQHDVIPVIVNEVAVQYIHTQGQTELARMMFEGGIEAAIHVKLSVTPPVLELLCSKQSKKTVEAFAEAFPKKIASYTLKIPNTVTRQPVSQEFCKYCEELSTEQHVLVITKSDELQICGFINGASEVQKSVKVFFRKKCIVTKAFCIPKGMWRLLGGRMKPKWIKIEKICQANEITFTLRSDDEEKLEFKGDKTEVENVIETMNSLIKSIYIANVPLKRPEIKHYFSDNEDGGMKIPAIERNAHVCIELCTVGEGEEWGVEDELHPTERAEWKATSLPPPKLSKECTAQVVGMKSITICVGDITEFRAEVIVNAANEDLKHVGGIADAILKKGGQEIQIASDHYVKGHRRLNAGEVWLSNVVGKLPCSALIHAVGPRWHSNPSRREQLRQVCINILRAAKDYNSIALPAISSGVFGCPIDQCAEVMVAAIIDFCKSQRGALPDDINIVLFKQADVPHFVQSLRVHVPSQNIRERSDEYETSSLMSSSSQSHGYEDLSQPSPYTYQQHHEEDIEEEEEEIESEAYEEIGPSFSRVQVKQGSILDVEAEIYVNSTNANMDLSGGAVAQALSKAAGPALQAECTKKAPIAAGEIAVTGPGNIRRCKCIIHINCPGYDNKTGGNAEKVLRTIMNKCMKECDRRGASTIVFPAIGTGNLGFPIDIAARIMVDEVCNYLQKNKCKSLGMVYFIIFMENMYRTFVEELETRNKTEIVPTKIVTPKKKEKKARGFRGRRYVPAPQTEVRVDKVATKPNLLENGITVEVAKGDITLEKTDVIVNTTDDQMSLGGGVGAALARRAGKGFEDACKKVKANKKRGLRKGEVISTTAGHLRCKCVFHIMFQKHNFVEVVSGCIEKAHKHHYNSVAFPAIGTGTERFPVDEAAKGMIKGLQQCKPPPFQMHVRIVLLEDVYGKFIAALESQQQSWFRRAAKTLGNLVWGPTTSVDEEPMDVDDTEDIELRIYGETKECVKSAEESVYGLINRQFKTEIMDDERIHLLPPSEEKVLQREARRMQIMFRIDRNLSSIEFKGSKEGIAEMKFKVHKTLSKLKEETSRRAEAERMKKTVQWKRQDSDDTPYEPLTNLEIEEEYHACGGKSRYSFKDDDNEEHFTIDFKEMVEIDHALKKKYSVRRVTIGSDGDALPMDWEPMVVAGKICVIDLAPDSKGYKFALEEFNKTMTQGTNYSAIVSIQRIQNQALYEQYAAEKKKLDSVNPSGVKNECWLFHGTKESAVSQINKTSFNRSFRGQNGTVYGQGCYFASMASYSNGYASVDSKQQKRMYLVRVLTGEYTQGRSDMMIPPPKDPNDPTVPHYNSVVDNTTNPTIFVVFYDHDAYPEYLLTYT